ncbi:hypothetical protein ACP4OV_015776 [Aristida adscensionis]
MASQVSDEQLKTTNTQRNGNKYLINLIELSAQTDLSLELTAAMSMMDGALVVVDCVESVSLQTDVLLLHALGDRIRPVLTLDKIDRCFLELQVDGEVAYHTFSHVIHSINVSSASNDDGHLGDVQVCPGKGTVAFSGQHGWAFTLTRFAKMYASKFGVDEAKMMEMLWGENFFDKHTNKWTTKNTCSSTCKRGFVQFCYEPIKEIINTCMNGQKEKLWPMLQKLNITMMPDDKELTGKALMNRVMQAWLPAGTALIEMMIFHLPSPPTAQKHRVENLYEGPLGDTYSNAIRNCDTEGPLMLYVSLKIPTSDKGSSFAFGHVFSGKVSTGMNVRIMASNGTRDQKEVYANIVHSPSIWMGKKLVSVEDIPCGSTVALVGMDQFVAKNATLTNVKEVNAYPIRAKCEGEPHLCC